MWSAIRFLAGIVLSAVSFLVIAQSVTSARATEVNLLLALTADVSGSVDDQKFALEREGYSAAITSPQMIEAIQSGRLGRIAICYIEWSGIGNQRVLIDWTVIEDAASAQRFAVRLAEAPRSFFSRTSISGGIDFAIRQIKHGRFGAKRRVISVSMTANPSRKRRSFDWRQVQVVPMWSRQDRAKRMIRYKSLN